RRRPCSTLFPYTTLFRSLVGRWDGEHVRAGERVTPGGAGEVDVPADLDADGGAGEDEVVAGRADQVVVLEVRLVRGQRVVVLGRSEEHTSELQSRGHLVC